MSFITFTMGCNDCKKEWNTAFGIQGTTQIATPSEKCPKCNSKDIKKIADGWRTTANRENGSKTQM